MARIEIWSILICGLRAVQCFHTVFYEYHFINTGMTWSAAQQYCRLHYDDLATFTSLEDIQRVKRPSDYTYAWIGLFDDTASWKGIMGNESNSWRWSATGTTSPGGYQKWEAGQPDFTGANNACGMMKNGLWGDDNCMAFQSNFFVCFTGSLQPGSKQYFFMQFYRTWTEARNYCRTHYVDLAVIENASELTTVANMIGSLRVWIGLYRQPFRWSDNRISLFKNWYSGEPDNKQNNEHCVVEYSNKEHHWLDASCHGINQVICQQALKTRTTLVRVVLRTDADLTDAATNAQVPDEITTMFRTLGLSDVKVSWKKSPVKQVERGATQQ